MSGERDNLGTGVGCALKAGWKRRMGVFLSRKGCERLLHLPKTFKISKPGPLIKAGGGVASSNDFRAGRGVEE